MALLSLLVCVALWQSVSAEEAYTVPEPYIQALRPKGVRFSIPDGPGVELFAVHANINKEMRQLEAGEISSDVLRPRDGRWVYEDLRTALRPGDRLNYWLYVKRNGLGFRRDDGSFTVTELVDRKTPATPPVASYEHCPQMLSRSKGSNPRRRAWRTRSSSRSAEGCHLEGGGSAVTQQRLRHAEELHQQRLRHAEELHQERLRQLQQQKQQQQHAGHAPEEGAAGGDTQDVSAFKRIGAKR